MNTVSWLNERVPGYQNWLTKNSCYSEPILETNIGLQKVLKEHNVFNLLAKVSVAR